MSLVSKLMVIILFIILPMVVGGIWIKFLDKKDKYKLLVQIWVYGFITIFAITQLVAVPMIANKIAFSKYIIVWCTIIIIISLISIVFNVNIYIKHKKSNNFTELPSKFYDIYKMKFNYKGMWLAIIGVVAFGLIVAQGFIGARYEHKDDDDARFIALEMLALESDTMITQNPIHNSPMYWNRGEMKKDLTSPWVIYMATYSKVSGIHPAVMSHRVVPFIFIFLSYAACTLLGFNLFKRNYEKIMIFLILISIANIFGYISTHTTSAMLLLRLWQGKAVFAGIMIPIMMSLLFEIFDNYKQKIWYVLLFVSGLAASLTSGGGIIISLILVGIYGLVNLFKNRDILSTICVWLCAIPSVAYSLCYYFVNSIFKMY